MAREKLRPSYSTTPAASADSRPRVYLRLLEERGQVAIGYRSHPTGIERTAASIELAMAAALPDVSEPAVILWAGTGSTFG